MIPWRIAIFGLLALLLVGGLAWFERSRPSSRTLALVAALAALAVAGRLAFAAVPNVQATTDVVLITGFAVGATPGFAVGALGALISNFWLGQGPWTPWEMVGWGLVGLGGAGLAVLTRRRLGRIGLALACGLAGLAYGAFLDYSVMATSGGAQSLDRYLAISARGVPFNVAHALGNFVLALAAGPALVRIISRYRDRVEFTWRREWAAPLLAVAVVAGALGGAAVRAGASGASKAPSAYLAAAKNKDGGYGVSPGSASSPEMTGWAMLGLEAAGVNPLDLGHRHASPPAYLRKHAAKVKSTGDLERTILALHGAGINARDFAGRDLVKKLRKRRHRNGSFQGEVNLTAFGILALRAVGKPQSSVRSSRRWLQGARNNNGGWGFQPGVASDADSTGAALQGLAAASAGKRALRRGVSYLSHDQKHDGGWPLAGRGASNSQSTAWAVQGLIAARKNPDAIRSGGHSGLDYLAARRTGNGHYRYSRTSDQTPVWVTGQAVMAVERRALPLAAVKREPKPQSSGGGSDGDLGPNGNQSGNSGGTAPPPSTSGSTPAPIVNAANAAPTTSPNGGSKKRGGKGHNAAKSAHPHGGPAPATAAKPAPKSKQSKGSAAPLSTTRAKPSTPAADSGDDGGTPAWLYAAAGAAALALLGAGGVWWYRSGGWVPPRPSLPRLR